MEILKLADAFGVINEANPLTEESRPKVFLGCGFTPVHLQTFLAAYWVRRSGVLAEIEIGVYGDLLGNLDRAARGDYDYVVVALEWGDLDPRLGYRTTNCWRAEQFSDIREEVKRRMSAVAESLVQLSRRAHVAVALPSLPLPPAFSTPNHVAHTLPLALKGDLFEFAANISVNEGVHVLNPDQIDTISPLDQRLDLTSEIRSGFPYTISHSSRLARELVTVCLPPAPKKGLVVDLDNTLWRGILGEDGPDGITWRLDDQAHGHALFQECLASLAESGVLLAIASKNDPDLVTQALGREDLVISPDQFFPIEAHWGPKSQSLQSILEAWNIAPDSVVFVDDNAMELAEVNAQFPDIETIEFPVKDDRRLNALLNRLRDLFGKTATTDEDKLRLSSLRSGAAVKQAHSIDDFLAAANAEITVTFNDDDQRTLELINKTNQFNLNGRRIDRADWLKRLEDPDAFLASISYQDKFGPLGKIAVISGRRSGDLANVDVWVMSCRAFSRRIEYNTLGEMFRQLEVSTLRFDFTSTERNGPLSEFFESVTAEAPTSSLTLTAEDFAQRCPQLFAKVQ